MFSTLREGSMVTWAMTLFFGDLRNHKASLLPFFSSFLLSLFHIALPLPQPWKTKLIEQKK